MKPTVERDWTTKAGLRAVIRSNFMPGLPGLVPDRSWLCGYVEVPRDHALYGVDYDAHCEMLIDAAEVAGEQPIGKQGIMPLLCAAMRGSAENLPPTAEIALNVHGSITFSGSGDRGFPIQSEGWWFGFDCLHAGDDPDFGGTRKDMAYVAAECESLAEQLAKIKLSPFTEEPGMPLA